MHNTVVDERREKYQPAGFIYGFTVFFVVVFLTGP